jgi:hypothetical protein
MASPMPAHSSGWNQPPAAGETVDEYGLQTKFMNCTRSLSVHRLVALLVPACACHVFLVGRQRLIQPRQ